MAGEVGGQQWGNQSGNDAWYQGFLCPVPPPPLPLCPIIIFISFINNNNNNNPLWAIYRFKITPVVFISFHSQSSPVRRAEMYRYPPFYI